MKLQLLITTLFLSLSTILAQIIEVDDSNFESLVFGTPNKYSFVYFYSPRCKHCQNLEPHFRPLSELYEDTKLQIFKINALDNQRIRNKYGLVGYPVLKLFVSNGDQIGFYNGIRTTTKLIEYLQEATGVQPNYPPSSVIEIKPSNIQKVIYDKLANDVVLVFYANWVEGWDNDYNSFYERLAKYYEDYVQDGTIFASVDVSDSEATSLISKYQVTKYPTLFYFPKGRENNEEEVYMLDHDVGPEEVVGVLMESDVGQLKVDIGELNRQAEEDMKKREAQAEVEEKEEDDDELWRYREL